MCHAFVNFARVQWTDTVTESLNPYAATSSMQQPIFGICASNVVLHMHPVSFFLIAGKFSQLCDLIKHNAKLQATFDAVGANFSRSTRSAHLDFGYLVQSVAFSSVHPSSSHNPFAQNSSNFIAHQLDHFKLVPFLQLLSS